jgi:hypothetical protein
MTERLMKTSEGWSVFIPGTLATQLSLSEESTVVMSMDDHTLHIDIIPPLSPELEAIGRKVYDRFKDAFAEIKRHGD